jgi:NADPH:quinone reductase-like Zn-dependent oxidoreductase
MYAVRLHTPDGPAGLVYGQIEIPQPKAGEVLVRVHAAAITRDELDWPVNRLPAVPSYEFSGVVDEIGENVVSFAVGEEVYALSPFDRDGAAAEYITVPQECLAPKPKTIDHIQSAAIPMPALTAWQGLFDHGQLTKGQRVLIHGATGGVGHCAVQLACQRGAYVIGTASNKHIEFARNIGVDQIIDTSTTRFEDVVRDVDLVFDTVGGERLERSPSVICRGGRLISVATEPPKERANERGIESLYFVVSPNRGQLIEITKLVEAGYLQPAVAEVFPLSEARQAFERSLVHHGAGKIVLQVVEE